MRFLSYFMSPIRCTAISRPTFRNFAERVGDSSGLESENLRSSPSRQLTRPLGQLSAEPWNFTDLASSISAAVSIPQERSTAHRAAPIFAES